MLDQHYEVIWLTVHKGLEISQNQAMHQSDKRVDIPVNMREAGCRVTDKQPQQKKVIPWPRGAMAAVMMKHITRHRFNEHK